MKKFKITSCSNSILWYVNHIGKEFEILKEDKSAYWTLEPDSQFRLLNWVLKVDVELLPTKEGNHEAK